MKIIKFGDFSINEVRVSTVGKEVKRLAPTVYLGVLDVVIDDAGNLYDGTINKLIKGRVQRKDGEIIRILGTDGKDYPAGIEKGGRLVSVRKREDELTGNIVALSKDSEPLPISKSLIKEYNLKVLNITPNKTNWIIGINDNGTINYVDYYELIPIMGTGWVNIKVDMEIVKRVRRYSSDIGTQTTEGHQNFLSKLKEFEEISAIGRKVSVKKIEALSRRRVQKEMSVIILLHYINEIKDFFTPSSSGFLFESFLAGLIPDARVNDNNTAADLIADGYTYQVKFLSESASSVEVVLDTKIDINTKEIKSENYLSYYIVSIKFIDKIEVYIIDATTSVTGIVGPIDKVLTDKGDFSMSKVRLNANKKDSVVKKYTIDLKDIEGRIENLGRDLKKNLDTLYLEISDFQYNVETIISGIDKDGKRMTNNDFDLYDSKSKTNIGNLQTSLDLLIGSFKRDKKVQ